MGVGDAAADRGGGVNAGRVLQRRISGDYAVDETGFDPDIADLVAPLVGIGWRIRVEGADRLPDGPAVLVHPRVVGPPETFAVVRGVRLATGRRVRFLGIPDVDPVGPFLRKLGGALAHPAELAGLLRAGHLVAVGERRALRPKPGPAALPAALAAVAFDLDVPIVPVGVRPGLLPGHWRVTIS